MKKKTKPLQRKRMVGNKKPKRIYAFGRRKLNTKGGGRRERTVGKTVRAAQRNRRPSIGEQPTAKILKKKKREDRKRQRVGLVHSTCDTTGG